ncbi:MAG: cell division protein FtsB [Oceanospirillales bacterium TMED33]|nr:cell division protein FtsB [Gammaproteobacteria bacterium]RPG22244.1 MAG: cell division protein FtsB [Oceanospirillales bacterium TMED33]CAI8403436.1 MAG: Cell division protein FtsB [Gammaproteobacteria bacterium]|tara:strand:+ start:419 stop:715 length:297 start_codon:yes stop_codon:yes gene_type:complete
MTGRIILVGLGILLVLSQYQLWLGTGSISELQRLTDELEKQELENQRLASRNDELVSEINALKTDPQAIEELLRSRFGYVKEGETFVRLLPKGELPSE